MLLKSCTKSKSQAHSVPSSLNHQQLFATSHPSSTPSNLSPTNHRLFLHLQINDVNNQAVVHLSLAHNTQRTLVTPPPPLPLPRLPRRITRLSTLPRGNNRCCRLPSAAFRNTYLCTLCLRSLHQSAFVYSSNNTLHSPLLQFSTISPPSVQPPALNYALSLHHPHADSFPRLPLPTFSY